MLTEKLVRGKIKNCKAEISAIKFALNTEHNIGWNTYLKAELRYQKEKLKRLRRELPAIVQTGAKEMHQAENNKENDWTLYFDKCPVCKKNIGFFLSDKHYCPYCGQRLKRGLDK